MVYATGMRTEFGKIAHLTQTAGEPSSPLQREIARLSRIVAALATSMGVAMFFIGEALGLGAEKPDPGVMSRPPRARSERLLSWGLIARAYLFLGALEAAASMAMFFFVLDAAGRRGGLVARSCVRGRDVAAGGSAQGVAAPGCAVKRKLGEQ
jgi:magnesium-transporting ATPase (P-type)